MKKLFGLLLLILIFSACGDSGPSQPDPAAQTASLHALMDSVFDAGVALDPNRQAYLGIKTDQDKWTDISEAAATERMEVLRNGLASVQRRFQPEKLDAEGKLSYKIFARIVSDAERKYKYRDYEYPVNQMFGLQSRIPNTLLNMHRISDKKDAEDYVSRIQNVRPLFRQLEENIRGQAEKGVMLPKAIFPLVIGQSEGVIAGQPFDKSLKQAPIWEDFQEKMEKLSLGKAEKEELLGAARTALVDSLGPAYRDLIALLREQEATSSEDFGAWKFPEGKAYYSSMLAYHTTTDMDAEAIHLTGISEVKRIQAAINQIKFRVGFEGSIRDFFKHLRDSDEFYYPDTEEGKAEYLARAEKLIADMKKELPNMFGILPKADIVVKPVEAFREASAGKAFYNQPAPDGSRPGTYYVNLYNMRDVPIYQMEALAYHEGVPGHHMQIAIAQEQTHLPKYRQQGENTAYIEGWGLYSEYLPYEHGFYKGIYDDLGRLAMELWRAARLVVDTGIHDQEWTREEAIAYLVENTPNSESDCTKAIERYGVMPGQATAYLIGKMELLRMREEARASLGESFDLKGFHDRVLGSGTMPLDLLDSHVRGWVTETKQAAAAPAQ